MCGIAGIYRFQDHGGFNDAVLEEMLRRLARRGPDDHGRWRENGVELGHRRLAILDLSTAGHQPMLSARGRYVLVFNGEIYNHREIAHDLDLGPNELRSRSDTEILLEAWAHWGHQSLNRLVGPFAFAVYDRLRRSLWLVRDRFGEKPLFYHHSGDRLSFASSIPALLSAPWVDRSLDPDAVVEFAALRYVVSPRTILREVRKIPPGHLMQVTEDGCKVIPWYSLPIPARSPRRHLDPRGEFDALLRQATQRCLVSDVPVGVFLSDGIDSQAIAHVAPESIPAYSYAHAEGEPPAIGRPTTLVRVSDESRLDDLDTMCSALTEPTGDGVALATWHLLQRARADATVFLCGHGGDEILGGYRMHTDLIRLRFFHLLRYLPSAVMERSAGRRLNGYESFAERWSRLRRSRWASAPAAARSLIQRPLPQSDLRELFGKERELLSSIASVDQLYDRCHPRAGALDCIQHVLAQTFLSENLLSFSDAVGMAWSAEIRMPYLDRDLVEFVLTRPASERVRARPDRASTKLLLRSWARGRLPDAVISRRKHGFSSGSVGKLLERDRSGMLARMLDLGALRVAIPGLESWLKRDPASFHGPREGTLWALVTLGSWYQQLPRSARSRESRARPREVRAS